VSDTAGSSFPHTRWSVVLRLKSPVECEHRRALSDLCEAYWRPIYTFARRCGHTEHDAEDFTQGFMAGLIRRGGPGEVSAERGRLRLFLKAAFRNYITDEIRRATREKRGGKCEALSLDVASAERQFEKSFSQSASPDAAFDLHWARTLLQRALRELRRRFAARGRADTLRELEGFLGPDHHLPSCRDLAARLQMTENSVAAAIHRLRGEFRGLPRAEVADTLAADEDVDEELRYLLHVLA
jgi:RNA polymerase sigma-70 factor (ECF subfamily)